MNAIEIRDLGKRYRIGRNASTTLREAVPELLRGPSRRVQTEEIWALRGVDLQVQEGEVIGIVGSNGAGKSTLLKILARITEPTTGLSRTRGRVGALLDVGTGFHGELTGRENIYVNGALLGLSRRAIRARLDDIVAFAEVERFIDTPLKRYSSGMQLRLAFAIAAEIQPEIVVVDEVLAVGDAEFQRRCIGRMSEMQQSGRTVVFVSHDSGAVAELCDRVVWLSDGRVAADGPTRQVLAEYLTTTQGVSHQARFQPRPDLEIYPVSAAVRSRSGSPRREEPLTIEVICEARVDVRKQDLAIILATNEGVRVLDEAWSDRQPEPLRVPANTRCLVRLEVSPCLAADRYSVYLWLGDPYGTAFEEPLLNFDLLPRADDSAESVRRRRVVQPHVEWSAHSVAAAP